MSGKKSGLIFEKMMQLELIYGQRPNKATPRDSFPYNLIKYIDNNFVSNPRDRKSIIRYCFFYNEIVVS